MQKGIIISYKSSQKQFFLSKNTQLHLLTALFKRIFHINADIKGLKHPRGYSIPIQDIFNFSINQPFQLILQQQNSDEKSRSQTFSQKALTKRSGRKFPPQEKQLNQAKLFIDDFQFFMTEVASKKNQFFCGIVFFNNKKNSTYLGKKILRELIYQFDQLMFFYALHPLKRHSASLLLGETLNFAVFKGTKLIHQRQFPSNLSATQQIIGYLKLLIKKGQIPQLHQQVHGTKKQLRHNLIQCNQQRSFDIKRSKDLDLDLDTVPPSSNFPQKVQPTPEYQHQIPLPIMKIQSPIKSQITNQINQISFENDLYQPDWFIDGDILTRLQKSFLSSLIKTGDQIFISFCHGLDLKNKNKQSLNIELIKVFLKDYINKKLSNFSEEQRYLIQLNQQNRQSYVFSLLLKLHKFGNIDDFITNINKQIALLQKNKPSYVQLARQIEKRRSTGLIKLRKDEDQEDDNDYQENKLKLISKEEELNSNYNKIANSFHKSTNNISIPIKIPTLPKQFTQSQKAIIIQSINKRNPFLIQNYIPSKWPKKKFNILKPNLVQKFLVENNERYGRFRNFPFNEDIKKKLHKLEQFNSLLYYLYKQRTINKKQKICFFYLYIWSDLNILGCFELYLLDRNIEDFIQTLYSIDYTYYLEDRYGIDASQVENFTVQIQLQLIILFLLSDYIQNISQKTTIQKFIRAGDTSFMQALRSNTSEKQLITAVLKLVQQKQKTLQIIQKEAQTQNKKNEKKKKEMKNFVDSIQPVHFKQFKQIDKIKQCIDLNQPILQSIFQVYFLNGEVVDWIESFQIYISNLKNIHMKIVLTQLCKKYNIEIQKLMLCRTDLLQGLYQVHLKIRDDAETLQTLERIILKCCK